MQLAHWRKRENLSCADIAQRLDLPGQRGSTSVWNWETGRARPDADMFERIFKLTNGEVTVGDMHETRLAWLRANRPDKFDVQKVAAE